MLGVIKNGVNCKQDKSGVGCKISRIETIASGEFNLDRVGYAELDEKEKAKYRLKKGDILFSHINSAPHVGKTAIVNVDADVYHGVNLLLLRPTPAISNDYLQLYLKLIFEGGYWKKTCKQSVNQASVNQQDLKKVPISYPSDLEEQNRIVALLDEAFIGLDAAIANTTKNLANASELLDGALQRMFLDIDGCEKVTLQELLERGWIVSHLDGNHGSDYPKRDEFVETGVPYISANCIRDDAIDVSMSKFLTASRAASIRKGVAKDRDVIFAHNATVGPVAMLYTAHEKIILGTSLTYYRCNEKNIVPEYLAHYMRTPIFKQQYEAVMGQSTRNQVPITKQREFYHLIPSLEVQKTIADELDSLRESAKQLDSIYRNKIVALNELKQSLLHKAFNGQLTANAMTEDVAI